jgi:hypothetical protein
MVSARTNATRTIVPVAVTPPPDPGLCASCRHVRLVTGARSTFVRCGLAERDPRFPRYPPLPVRRCEGYVSVNPQATRP